MRASLPPLGAAYYNPATSSYFTYPTSSNTAPTQATADVDGNVSNPGANVANYNLGADWNGQNGNVTTVGSAGAASPYLTFDQGGNVFEWTETIVGAPTRVDRGGSWDISSTWLLASSRDFSGTGNELSNLGFRVATVAITSSVPESSPLVFGALATLAALVVRRFLPSAGGCPLGG